MDDETDINLTVYDRLRVDLVSGRWLPGQKLGIDTLRSHYESGAAPLREALNRLAAEGWVDYLKERGFAVTGASEPALRELVDTRICVETLALNKSILRSTTEWEEKVVLALHRLSKKSRSLLAERYEENPDWEKQHRAFHMTLIENCGSRWLSTFCGQLYDQAYRYRQLAVKTAYKARDELDEHRMVVDAIVRGDAPAACTALHQHYTKTADIILNADIKGIDKS